MDKAKPPGHTSYDGVYPLPEKLGTLKGCLGWLLGYLNPWNFLVNSPNAIWLLVALTDYVFTFPDEAELMAGCKTWSRDWIAVRVATNTVIMLGYFGFFSICLYVLGFGSRSLFRLALLLGYGRPTVGLRLHLSIDLPTGASLDL